MASRKQQKQAAREERQRRAAAEAAARARRRRIGFAVGVAAAIGLIAGFAALIVGGSGAVGETNGGWPNGTVPSRRVEDLSAAAKAAGCRLLRPRSEGHEHTTESVTYRSKPPASGKMDPTPAPDAANLSSPGTEAVVHSLEHGRVAYWFSPTSPPRVKGALKALYDEDEAFVVLAPDTTGMRWQVAASAWERVLACPTYNEKVPDALRAFRDERRLKGPEYAPTPNPA